MAASTDTTKEPRTRTLFRFMNAVRQENTEQAVQLLRPHSADDRLGIVFSTTLLIPSSEKTLRSVIQSEYLNNKSASDEDINEAAALVLCTESLRLVYNIVIESSPLLLAIKQGSVDEVRSLLQQLPRDEAVRLINGPDVQSAVLSILNGAKYEEKLCTCSFYELIWTINKIHPIGTQIPGHRLTLVDLRQTIPPNIILMCTFQLDKRIPNKTNKIPWTINRNP